MPDLRLISRRPWLVFSGILCGAAALSGCGAAEPQVSPELAARKALPLVQQAACFQPALSSECQAGYQVTFGSSRNVPEKDRIAGALWCEKGRAFGHFEGRSGEVTAPVAPVVWEAVWRVLTQTEDCATAYGATVFVTRKGIAHPCEAARFKIDSLLNAAYYTARTGPPNRPAPSRREPPSPEHEDEPDMLQGICEIDPRACPSPNDPCPPFLADPWNGIVAAPATPQEIADAVPPEPVTDQDPCENRRRPPHGLVTKAIAAELPRARQCIPATADVSQATLTFQNDGTVQSVAVTGWATGKASSACIRTALGRVWVPSFLDPTFSVTVTIRPH